MVGGLIDVAEPWREHWRGMPEFVQEDLRPWRSIKVNFRDKAGLETFSRLIGHGFTEKSKFTWFPEAKPENLLKRKCVDMDGHRFDPHHPIYIISKGRWESRLTSKALEKMNVPYHIVIEPQEYDDYARFIDPAKILVLPFSNLGQGSIPARNWVWEHSISIGAERHWILDDNISEFYRLNRNMKYRVYSGTIFRVIEDFVDRYENVAMAGMQYELLAPRKTKMPPFYFNTRIYSCILIKNDLPHRWRGRYNEDTDLSLRVLKDGWCTVLFNAFLANKMATMRMKGGNTDELYRQDDKFDGRLAMAESLQEQHPDVARSIKKWNRWQHHVDYSFFRMGNLYKGLGRNQLKLRDDVKIPDGINDYGMELIDA